MKAFIQQVFILSLLFVFNISRAQEDPNKEIVSLKSVVSIDDKPIVYQNQVRGGVHQIDSPPEEIPKDRVQKSMIVTNTITNQSYRYNGDTNTNTATQWEPIYIVTSYQNEQNYEIGEIVIDTKSSGHSQLFKALQTLSNTSIPPYQDQQNWRPIGEAVEFIDKKTEDHKIVSGGQTLVFADGDYVLPPAASVVGQTYVIKNKIVDLHGVDEIEKWETGIDANTGRETTYKVSTKTAFQIEIKASPGDLIDSGMNPIFLFKLDDFKSLISDGEKWHLIGSGGSRDLYLYPWKPARDISEMDGVYYGTRNNSGKYVSGSYRVVCHLYNGTYIYSIQRYSSGDGWLQTFSN